MDVVVVAAADDHSCGLGFGGEVDGGVDGLEVGEGLMDGVPVVVVPRLQVGPLAVQVLHEFLPVVRVAVQHLMVPLN